MSLDLNTVHRQIIEITHQAGEKILEYYEAPYEKSVKSNDFDIVTEADKAAEEVIISAIRNLYPDHHIIGEESGSVGAHESASYRWYVDPIDGTTNFANNLPIFSVSIALTDRDKNPLVGVVYNPVYKEMFSAIKGQGATMNDRKISVSDARELGQCVLVSGFPYTKATDPDNNLAQWGYFLTRTRGMRRYGSAALDLCFVAAGRFDGYWEMSLNPWDVLAGTLIVREAGGKVSDYRGDESTAIYRKRTHLVASNGHIHDLMLEGLKESGASQTLVTSEDD